MRPYVLWFGRCPRCARLYGCTFSGRNATASEPICLSSAAYFEIYWESSSDDPIVIKSGLSGPARSYTGRLVCEFIRRGSATWPSAHADVLALGPVNSGVCGLVEQGGSRHATLHRALQTSRPCLRCWRCLCHNSRASAIAALMGRAASFSRTHAERTPFRALALGQRVPSRQQAGDDQSTRLRRITHSHPDESLHASSGATVSSRIGRYQGIREQFAPTLPARKSRPKPQRGVHICTLLTLNGHLSARARHLQRGALREMAA